MKIVFVCTGNTCRSPMAEGLARKIFGRAIEVESMGLAAWEGDEASPQAVIVMEEKGIDLSSHRARPIIPEVLTEADWIIPMTSSHEAQLKSAFPELSSKIKPLGAWSKDGSQRDLKDPWGGSVEIYRDCALQIEKYLHIVKENL
ncbi:MAG: low molecular weight protein arginine phosphatase [Desulfitobacterium sp.]|nr:low molecular weight protein arginine phosphatase [Desulfitobacterium sp.]